VLLLALPDIRIVLGSPNARGIPHRPQAAAGTPPAGRSRGPGEQLKSWAAVTETVADDLPL